MLVAPPPLVVAGTDWRIEADRQFRIARRSANVMVVVAFCQFLTALFVYYAHSRANLIVWSMAASATIFLLLCLWADKSPLPALITGLVLYVSELALSLIRAVDAPPGMNGGVIGFAVLLIIVIIAVLIVGIVAGVNHRRLQMENSP